MISADPPGPLRIGVDARELQGRPTGTGRYLRNLLRLWCAQGRDRYFAYVAGQAPDDPALDHPHITTRILPRASHGVVWQQRLLPPAVATDALDVFLSPAYTCPLVLGVPRVTAIHDMSFFQWPSDFALLDGLRRRLLVRLSARASRRILVCSDFTRRETTRILPDLSARIRHVPLGPDTDLAPAMPREAARSRLGVRGPMILTVGAILNRRCLPTLLAAVARLRRAWPDLRLDVVGENRTHPRLDLPAQVGRLGLGDTVTFSGFVDEAELALRYAAADVAVFLSEYEGFGLPPLEAASRGVPLVVANRPSLNEIFGKAAVCVEPRDEGGVADALSSILADAGLAQSLRERGRATAGRYSWAETARLTREALVEAAVDA